MSLPTPQYTLPGYLCRSAVRVPTGLSLAVFLGSMITCAVADPRRGQRTVVHQLGRPKHFNGDVRRPAAVPLLRHRVAPEGSHGMLTVSAIGVAARRSLRTRLTPG